MKIRISRSHRLIAATVISAAFFLAEISVGFYTHSLALVADAFHYLNDLVGFIVALVALKVSKTDHAPQELSFGWQRAQILGAFFNGSLLFALGISIFLQSVERFITLHHVENPKLMFIIGSIGLGLNIICVTFLHEHHHHGGYDNDDHHGHHHEPALPARSRGQVDVEQQGELGDEDKHRDHRHLEHDEVPVFGGHDLGMMGVLLHVLGDAANNLGVMIAALVIWLTQYEARYYADPATSMGIAAMIMLSAFPLVRKSGFILLESAPNGIQLEDVKHDLEKISGILAVHELHVWRLNQKKVLASVHVAIKDHSASEMVVTATISTVQECLHAWGVHSVTVQPELISSTKTGSQSQIEAIERRYPDKCQSKCRSVCKELACCG
ncbi:cation efflux protein [Aspergillus crustosus]